MEHTPGDKAPFFLGWLEGQALRFGSPRATTTTEILSCAQNDELKV